MKKLFLLLALLFIGGISWATPDVVMPKEYSGNQQIQSTPTTVYSVNVSYVGAVAGQSVQLIDGNGASPSTTGVVRFTCVAATTSGTCVSPYSMSSAYFGTGLFLKENNNGQAGVFKTDIQSF